MYAHSQLFIIFAIMDVMGIVSMVGGLGGLGFLQWIYNRKNLKKMDEVTLAEKYHDINIKLLERVDEWTTRNRELADKLYRSEQMINELNADLREQIQITTNIRLISQHYENWLCKKGDCAKREPKNETLAGKRYFPPLCDMKNDDEQH